MITTLASLSEALNSQRVLQDVLNEHGFRHEKVNLPHLEVELLPNVTKPSDIIKPYIGGETYTMILATGAPQSSLATPSMLMCTTWPTKTKFNPSLSRATGASTTPTAKIDLSGQGRDIYPTTVRGIMRMPSRWCAFNGDRRDMEKLDWACKKSDCTTTSP
ncbi:hypothetical protein SASPL_126860 [Salvia splendens]|uniref:Uncharacterized protein n=1 Tax=Salvia splendens TaxID=180675 RepID=A0A8X8XJS1_SALSN|nr:hypothetical protein SASPL_126860 [Salvia splendens]